MLAAGALGLGAAQRADASGSVPSRVWQGTKPTDLKLYGRNFHLHAPDRRAGQVPVKGEQHSAYGELLGRPNGKVVGHFTAAHLTHDSPFAAGASSLEIHTFALTDGTIHGLGSVAAERKGTSSSSAGPAATRALRAATSPGRARASSAGTARPSSI